MTRQLGLEPGDKVTLTIDTTVTKLVGDVLSYSYPLTGGTTAFGEILLGSGAVEVDHVAPANWPPRLDDLWRDCESALWFAVSGPADGEVLLTTNCSDTLDTPAAVLNQFGPLTLAFRDSQDEPAVEPAAVRIDSLIPRVDGGEMITVLHPHWYDGNPVTIVSLRLSAGDYVSVVFQLPGTADRAAVDVPADFMVTPVGGAS